MSQGSGQGLRGALHPEKSLLVELSREGDLFGLSQKVQGVPRLLPGVLQVLGQELFQVGGKSFESFSPRGGLHGFGKSGGHFFQHPGVGHVVVDAEKSQEVALLIPQKEAVRPNLPAILGIGGIVRQIVQIPVFFGLEHGEPQIRDGPSGRAAGKAVVCRQNGAFRIREVVKNYFVLLSQGLRKPPGQGNHGPEKRVPGGERFVFHEIQRSSWPSPLARAPS